MRKPDGTVIPSSYNVAQPGSAKQIPGSSHFSLKIGTIVQIYYPDDLRNVRKNKIEYDVLVKERDGDRGMSLSTYRNCIVNDFLGGLADYLEYTYRPVEEKPEVSSDPLFRDGSLVLLLCLYGDTNQAYIIGGQRHNRQKLKSNKIRGHFLEFEFNGINIEINKDGEMTLTYKSRTDIKGVPQDTESGGTFIKIDKTGSIEFNDNKAMKIRMDKPTSDITIETTERDIIVNAKRDMNITTGRDLNVKVDGQMVATVAKDALVTVGGKADVKVKKDAIVLVEGKTDITSKGKVDVKTDSEALVTAKSRVKIQAPLIEETNSGTTATDGVINGTSIDPFTGVPHIDFSTIVRAKK